MSDRRVLLRCSSNQYGFAIDAAGTFTVRCKDKHCRTSEGHGVIHEFDLASGSYVTRVDDRAVAAGHRPEEVDHDRRYPTV